MLKDASFQSDTCALSAMQLQSWRSRAKDKAVLYRGKEDVTESNRASWGWPRGIYPWTTDAMSRDQRLLEEALTQHSKTVNYWAGKISELTKMQDDAVQRALQPLRDKESEWDELWLGSWRGFAREMLANKVVEVERDEGGKSTRRYYYMSPAGCDGRKGASYISTGAKCVEVGRLILGKFGVSIPAEGLGDGLLEEPEEDKTDAEVGDLRLGPRLPPIDINDVSAWMKKLDDPDDLSLLASSVGQAEEADFCALSWARGEDGVPFAKLILMSPEQRLPPERVYLCRTTALFQGLQKLTEGRVGPPGRWRRSRGISPPASSAQKAVEEELSAESTKRDAELAAIQKTYTRNLEEIRRYRNEAVSAEEAKLTALATKYYEAWLAAWNDVGRYLNRKAVMDPETSPEKPTYYYMNARGCNQAGGAFYVGSSREAHKALSLILGKLRIKVPDYREEVRIAYQVGGTMATLIWEWRAKDQPPVADLRMDFESPVAVVRAGRLYICSTEAMRVEDGYELLA